MQEALAGQAMLAFWFGILSAVSLPIGAVLGLWLKPTSRIVAAIMAFGAGALLAALTLELVAEALEKGGFLPLALGSVVGAVIFVGFNQVLNEQGAFLRKPATLLKYLRGRKRALASDLLGRLSRVEILCALPPEEIQALLPSIRAVGFRPGERVLEEGDEGDALYLIESGEVQVSSRQGSTGPGTSREGERSVIARLGPGDTFGEMALLTGGTRVATVEAVTATKAWQILKDDFDRLLEVSPNMRQALNSLVERRRQGEIQRMVTGEIRAWHEDAVKSIEPAALSPTPLDVRDAVQQHGGGAPLAIWLGIFLDGIPESLVIGASMIGSASVSASLIAGLFLANLPESMSSAVGMSRQGYTAGRVLWMWGSLMVMTGIGAFLGNIFFQNTPVALFAAFEGAAAGAMLAMIAETMLPEAFEHGGHLVGIMTLLGFLAAIYVKTFETAS